MVRTRITVDAAMLASSIWVKAPGERDVGTVVLDEDGFGVIAVEASLRRGTFRRIRGLFPFIGELVESIRRVEAGSPAARSVHANRIIEHSFDVKA
jgi:hypothetical protein